MKNVDVIGKMKDPATLSQLYDALRTLQAVCFLNESCTDCPLYDREETETACLICKTVYGSLAETIGEARKRAVLSAVKGNEAGETEQEQTNGDRIRSMTDEELAEFLLSAPSSACGHCYFFGGELESCRLGSPCTKDFQAVRLRYFLSSPAGQAATEELSAHEKI